MMVKSEASYVDRIRSCSKKILGKTSVCGKIIHSQIRPISAKGASARVDREKGKMYFVFDERVPSPFQMHRRELL